MEEKKWGKVPKEYLTMTSYPRDTSAAAVKLFDFAEYEVFLGDEVEFHFKRHYQIKLLKESAKSYGDLVLAFRNDDKVQKIRAQTILPTGKKYKIKKIYDEREKGSFKVKKGSFPALDVGAIIEVQYEVLKKNFITPPPWYFQEPLPTIESTVTMKMSTGFMFTYNVHNDSRKRVVFSQEDYMNQDERKFIPMFIWQARNLPAVKAEPYISTLDNYRANVTFQFSGYRYAHANVKFIKDLPTLCNELLNDRDYRSFMKPDSKVKKLVVKLTEGANSNREKLQRVYEYARDVLQDETYTSAYSAAKTQKKVLKEGTASPSERNLFLLSMIRAAGMTARPVLISTRGNGRVVPEHAFLRQYNRTLVFTTLGRQIYLMDANDRFTPFGIVPPNCLVDVGLVIEKDNPQFLRNPNEDLKSIEILSSEVAVTESGKFSGTTAIQSIGYASRRRNRQIEKQSSFEDFIVNGIASDLDDLVITQPDTSATAAATDTFSSQFGFELDGLAEVIDSEIYLRPALFKCLEKNIFVTENREFPVEYGYRSKSTEVVNYILPSGSQVVEMPQNVIIQNDYLTYRRTISNFAGKLNYMRMFEVKQNTVPPGDYPALKESYARIVDADLEQVVLRLKD